MLSSERPEGEVTLERICEFAAHHCHGRREGMTVGVSFTVRSAVIIVVREDCGGMEIFPHELLPLEEHLKNTCQGRKFYLLSLP